MDQIPPFQKYTTKYFESQLKASYTNFQIKVQKITIESKEPTFENTIIELEYSAERLQNILTLLSTYITSFHSSELNYIYIKYKKLFEKQMEDGVWSNKKLFQKVNSIYHERHHLPLLKPFDIKLIEDTYQKFIDKGLSLSDKNRKKLQHLNQQIFDLQIKFQENINHETSNLFLIIHEEGDLKGLSKFHKMQAQQLASDLNLGPNKWVFTTHRSSYIPLLQNAEERQLRQRMLEIVYSKGNNKNENDNSYIVSKLAQLRLKKANLFGYTSYLKYTLKFQMAPSEQEIVKMLDLHWKQSIHNFSKLQLKIKTFMKKQGWTFKIRPWDWHYLIEQYHKDLYPHSELSLNDIFELECTLNYIFNITKDLFSIEITELPMAPKIHPDARIFIVEMNNKILGHFYLDLYRREGKKTGAWKREIRRQYFTKDGQNIYPIVGVFFNFILPVQKKSQPIYLSLNEVNTLFHEFGHALHGLLSKITYPSHCSANLPKDFSEIPSKLMEKWWWNKKLLKKHLKPFRGSSSISDKQINAIYQLRSFAELYEKIEYIKACYLDLAWHQQSSEKTLKISYIEKLFQQNLKTSMDILPRYCSTNFSHIWTRGHAGIYYSYLWADILSTEIYETFETNGIFNKYLANKLKEKLLSKGSQESPQALYENFKGHPLNFTKLLFQLMDKVEKDS